MKLNCIQKVLNACRGLLALTVAVGIGGLFAGELPDTMTRLEYIESTGTQYIDTEYAATAADCAADKGLVIEADICWPDLKLEGSAYYQSFVGVLNGSTKRTVPFCAFIRYSRQSVYLYNGGSEYSSVIQAWYPEGVRGTYRVQYRSGDIRFSADGREYLATNDTVGVVADYPFYVFARNNKGTAEQFAKTRCYGLRFSVAGELIRDYVPVRRKTDGALGLYDLENGTFAGNLGGGDDFVAGPEYAVVSGHVENMTGGTRTLTQDGYVHTFTESGELTVEGDGLVDVLVVGGGGAGGMAYGGGSGGGGGGVVYRQQFAVTAGVYRVSVGAGGAKPVEAVQSKKGEDGSASSVFGLIAYGGAGGAASATGGSAGGCGSGGGTKAVGTSGDEVFYTGGAGYAGQGYAGGSGKAAKYGNNQRHAAGGGGGAGARGADGVSNTDTAAFKYGKGGDGFLCDISGEPKYYGGGGGGGCSLSSKTIDGGEGGGGAGHGLKSSSGVNGEDGVANTGGGGGGCGGLNTSAIGGAGGSGIVIVRYMPKTDDGFEEITAEGAVHTRDGEYDVYTFKAGGTFSVKGCSFVDMLLVGGGGGGGAYGGGGGGGGQVSYLRNVLVPQDSAYAVSVGAGGTGGIANDGSVVSQAKNGETTSVTGAEQSFAAIGGGAGGTISAGFAGANGGGAGAYKYATHFEGTNITAGGSSTLTPSGFAGGSSMTAGGSSHRNSGGGGGAGAGANGADFDFTQDPFSYGVGGAGVVCAISGSDVCYGGGGGGGTAKATNGAVGGDGGGGRGAGYQDPAVKGANGKANTGGGGGGGSRRVLISGDGGDGGSGIVIIRCKRQRKGLMLIFR